MKKTSVIIFTLVVLSNVSGQNNSYFNEFFDNSFFNYSYMSQNKGFKAAFLGYKNLAAPYTPGYAAINCSYNNKDNLTFGVQLLNKSYQFLGYYQVNGIIGHRLALSENDSITLAINLGGAINTFNTSYINQYSEVDPYIELYNKSYFVTGAGFLYTFKNKLELGGSAPILANTLEGIKPVSYFNLGYNFYQKDFIIKPQAIYEMNNYGYFFDFSMLINYDKKYWVKYSYNTLKSSVFGIGVKFKLVDIGYGFKLNNDYYGKNLNNVHMLNIAIRH